MASSTDGVLVVVAAKDCPRPALARPVELLHRAGARLLGAAVNKTSPAFSRGLGKGS